MNINMRENGVAEVVGGGVVIADANDALDLFGANDCSAIVLRRENLAPDFFNLATGIAGEILQKFSTYDKKMAIIGDFEHEKSKALNDFIYECNRVGRILFVKTPEEAYAALGE